MIIRKSIPFIVIPSGLPGNRYQHVRIKGTHISGNLINVYSPPKGFVDIEKRHDLLNMLRQRQTEAEMQKQWIVFGGDWNGVTDPIRDRRPIIQRPGTHVNATNVDTEMQLFVEQAKLFDPGTRVELPQHPAMTYSRSEDSGIKA